MTKRIIALLLAASALLGTSGCFAKKEGSEAEKTNSAQTTSELTAPVMADESVSFGDAEEEETTDPQAEARKRDADIYKKFLRNGELSERTQNMNRYYVKVKYCLIDLDDDDVHELVLRLTNTEESGARGYPSESIVYTIVNDEPVAIGSVSCTGGTGGGDIFEIRYDNKNNKHVLVTDGEKRDSSLAAEKYVIVYSLKNGALSIQNKISSCHINSNYGTYSEKADKIMASTQFYTKDDDTLYYWIINNKYVSEEDCDNAFANLSAPTEGKYQYKDGTYSNPVKE